MNLKRQEIKRIVVKIGSSVICENNKISINRINTLVKQCIEIKRNDVQIVIVTSGAIVAGMERLNLKKRPTVLPGLQATAAAGQSNLMALYDKAFKERHIDTAQVLLTREDMHKRDRYLNAKNTFEKLLQYDTIPIVNENDTVAVEEIKFGDNDTLSALVSTLTNVDLLIILSDVKGIYVSPEKLKRYKDSVEFYKNDSSKEKKIIKSVVDIPEDMEKLCEGKGKSTTVGGMVTKIHAARIVTNCGIPCVVADGNEDRVLLKILENGYIGTHFFPSSGTQCARKRWIGYGSRAKGKIFVDEGAKEVLLNKGKSLLPTGICKVEGNFSQNENVKICDEKGNVFAKGLSYYSNEEIDKIKGKKTDEIEDILGVKYYDEVVHRDNLILL